MGAKVGRDLNIGIGLHWGQDTDPGLCPLRMSLQGLSGLCRPSFHERRIEGPGWAEERAESGQEGLLQRWLS